MRKYPDEFLGRCQTCLDNAMLSSEPCRIGYGVGQPVHKDYCMVRRAREQYDREQAVIADKQTEAK